MHKYDWSTMTYITVMWLGETWCGNTATWLAQRKMRNAASWLVVQNAFSKCHGIKYPISRQDIQTRPDLQAVHWHTQAWTDVSSGNSAYKFVIQIVIQKMDNTQSMECEPPSPQTQGRFTDFGEEPEIKRPALMMPKVGLTYIYTCM